MIKDKGEEIIRLYTEGFTYEQIAKFCHVSSATIRYYVRGMGLFRLPDDKRERAILKRRCALHLADLYRHHGRHRARHIAA